MIPTPNEAVRAAGAVVRYGAVTAVDQVDLTVAQGEFHVLLGASGSGKTTLLRAIAGFERLAAGELSVGGRAVDKGRSFVAPERRRVGVVFQDYALFPHLDVAKNVAFGMASRDEARVRELLDMVGLGDLALRKPAELSGGEQQRVALVRALAADPAVLLMDEPFSNLDPSRRNSLRKQTADLLRSRGMSAVLVTHDADEAMAMADNISVLAHGRLLQTGPPEVLYQRPHTPAVATALGPCVVLPITLDAHGRAESPLGRLQLYPGGPENPTLVAIRPSRVRLADDGVPATVVASRYRGAYVELDLELQAGERIVAHVEASQTPHEESVRVGVRGFAAGMIDDGVRRA